MGAGLCPQIAPGLSDMDSRALCLPGAIYAGSEAARIALATSDRPETGPDLPRALRAPRRTTGASGAAHGALPVISLGIIQALPSATTMHAAGGLDPTHRPGGPRAAARPPGSRRRRLIDRRRAQTFPGRCGRPGARQGPPELRTVRLPVISLGIIQGTAFGAQSWQATPGDSIRRFLWVAPLNPKMRRLCIE